MPMKHVPMQFLLDRKGVIIFIVFQTDSEPTLKKNVSIVFLFVPHIRIPIPWRAPYCSFVKIQIHNRLGKHRLSTNRGSTFTGARSSNWMSIISANIHGLPIVVVCSTVAAQSKLTKRGSQTRLQNPQIKPRCERSSGLRSSGLRSLLADDVLFYFFSFILIFSLLLYSLHTGTAERFEREQQPKHSQQNNHAPQIYPQIWSGFLRMVGGVMQRCCFYIYKLEY